MVRRAENVQVYYKRDLWGLVTRRYRILLQVGRREHLSPIRVTVSEFRDMAARSSREPVAYLTVGERTYWRFEDRWYTDNQGLLASDVHAVLVARAMRSEDALGRARTIAAQGRLPVPLQRSAVPIDVRQLVWQRDGGRCCRCGATNELQFDHVIPVSRGGGNDEWNLEVLCGPCNRRKGASV